MLNIVEEKLQALTFSIAEMERIGCCEEAIRELKKERKEVLNLLRI